jgi:hypothetical protein
MHPVAPARQPGRVYAGAAAHVEHHRRRRGQLTQQQLARTQQLEGVVRIPEQTLPFVLPGLVGEQVLTLRHQTIVEHYEARRIVSLPAYPARHPRLTRASPCGCPERPSCERRIESHRDRLQGIRPRDRLRLPWAPGPRAVRLVP